MNGSRLLIDESPLVVLPSLAMKIGLNQAIIVQQIHYWITIKQRNPSNYQESFKDGYFWVYNSTRSENSWEDQFPFWSEDTIKRAFLRLVKIGVLICENLSGNKLDHTNWYRINYEVLDEMHDRSPQNAVIGSPQNAVIDHRKMRSSINEGARVLSETSTETSTETKEIDHPQPTKNPQIRPPELQDVVTYFAIIGLPASEAQSFIDYYSVTRWKIVRGDNMYPCENWNALAGTWKKNYEAGKSKGRTTNPTTVETKAYIPGSRGRKIDE